ncbi:MAG: outer membrane beta-barrel protein [Prevotella sp.]|nr:outer membrane beta-barrel protein [Prevotella sp.]
MKKFLLSCMALLTAASASAQYYPDGRPIPPRKRSAYYSSRTSYSRPVGYSRYPNTYYGFRIGLGVATVHSDAAALDANNAKTGLNVGFVIGTQIAPSAPLFFESGLYYTEKGGKSNYNGSRFTYGLNYLELPLLLKYKYYASPDVSIEPFVGGYLAAGVGGKIKDYGDRQAYSSFDNDVSSSFRRFDGGLKVGCGVSFQMLYLGVSYDIGLANVGHYDFEDTRTGCLNLDFGVNF